MIKERHFGVWRQEAHGDSFPLIEKWHMMA